MKHIQGSGVRRFVAAMAGAKCSMINRENDLSKSFIGKDPIVNEQPYGAQLLRASNAIGTRSGRDIAF